MLIHALDPARLCGYAIGRAGRRPESGVIILRTPKEDRAVACGNLIAYLARTWAAEKPDLLAYEPPKSLGAHMGDAEGGKNFGGKNLESAFELRGIIIGMAQRYGIRCEPIYRNSVMWMFANCAGLGDYKLNKQAVVEGLIKAGMLREGSKDYDEADAIAIHCVASKKFANNDRTRFGLFA